MAQGQDQRSLASVGDERKATPQDPWVPLTCCCVRLYRRTKLQMAIQDQGHHWAKFGTCADEGVPLLHAADWKAERKVLERLQHPGHARVIGHYVAREHETDHP